MAPNDLEAFCTAEWPRLVGALSLYTGDADLAEELAQDAVAKLCRHWRRVQRMDAPAAWLHRVARNLAHSHYRRAAHRCARPCRAPVRRVESNGPDADAVTLRLVVASLPERERDTIVARFYLGYSVREAAAALGMPEGTVKTITHRAIARLRDAGVVDEEVIDA